MQPPVRGVLMLGLHDRLSDAFKSIRKDFLKRRSPHCRTPR
jgi:hypothetical protein